MQTRDIIGLIAGGAVAFAGVAAVAQSDAKARVDAAKAAGIVGE